MKVLLEFANAERLYPAFANMEDIRIDGLYTNSTLCGYDNSEFLNITVNSLYRAVDLYKKRLIDAFIICDTPRIETLKAKVKILLNILFLFYVYLPLTVYYQYLIKYPVL